MITVTMKSLMKLRRVRHYAKTIDSRRKEIPLRRNDLWPKCHLQVEEQTIVTTNHLFCHLPWTQEPTQVFQFPRQQILMVHVDGLKMDILIPTACIVSKKRMNLAITHQLKHAIDINNHNRSNMSNILHGILLDGIPTSWHFDPCHL